MKTSLFLQLNFSVLIGFVFTPAFSYAQADPVWLKTWNNAQAERPSLLASRGRITSKDEPGMPLVIRGVVTAPDGALAKGVVVHAYHRDSEGLDFGSGDNALSTWRLQGWLITDEHGQFEFQTIRPAPDHLGREAAHIHFTLESDEYGRQWVPAIFLADDPRVTQTQRRRSKAAGELASVVEVHVLNETQIIKVKLQLKEEADF